MASSPSFFYRRLAKRPNGSGSKKILTNLFEFFSFLVRLNLLSVAKKTTSIFLVLCEVEFSYNFYSISSIEAFQVY